MKSPSPSSGRFWTLTRLRVLGPDHPGTLTTYGGLAVLLQSMGRLEDAEPFFRRDLEGSERVLGPEHPDTLTALHNLAGVLEAQGRSVPHVSGHLIHADTQPDLNFSLSLLILFCPWT